MPPDPSAVPDAAATAAPSPQLPAQPPPRRHRILIALIAVVVLLLIVGVGGLLLVRRSAVPNIPFLSGLLPQAEDTTAPSPLPTINPSDIPPATSAAPGITPTSNTSLTPAPGTTPSGSSSPTPTPDVVMKLTPENLPTLLTSREHPNLGVTVGWQRNQTFTLTLDNLERVNQEATRDSKPRPQDPHSVVKLISASGETLQEKRFAVQTEFVGEFFDNPTQIDAALFQLDESSTYLVLPIDITKLPSKVQLLSSNGQVFAEQPIDFYRLPLRESPINTLEDLLGKSTPSPTPTAEAVLGIKEAQAATTPTGPPLPPPTINSFRDVNESGQYYGIWFETGFPPGCVKVGYTLNGEDPNPGGLGINVYTPGRPVIITEPTTVKARSYWSLDWGCPYPPSIVFSPSSVTTLEIECLPCFFLIVIGDHGLDTSVMANTAKQMVTTIHPWTEYTDKVRIVEVPTSPDTNFNCTVFHSEAAGKDAPTCQDTLARYALGSLAWDAVAIITDVCSPPDCAGGTGWGNFVHMTLPALSSVGTAAHEFGHATGALGDQYYYQNGNTTPREAVNCFPQQSECTDLKSAYPDLECALGCDTVSSYRSYTKLMHGSSAGIIEFGAFDACFMRNGIAERLGQFIDVEDCFANTGGDYWGWRR